MSNMLSTEPKLLSVTDCIPYTHGTLNFHITLDNVILKYITWVCGKGQPFLFVFTINKLSN